MKKLFLLLVIISFTFGMVFSQIITVTSPHAEDTWYKGTTYTITWTSISCADPNVKINIFRNSAVPANFVEQLTGPNSGSKSWPIPDSYINGNYVIRVKTVDNICLGDSGLFAITNRPVDSSITITRPAETGTYMVGGNLTIEWATTGLSENVKIELLRHGRRIGAIASRVASDSYRWDCKTLEEQTMKLFAGGGYAIRICTVDGAYCDVSDGTFTLKHAEKIYVTKPQFNETWDVGTYKTIKWTSSVADREIRRKTVLIDIIWTDESGESRGNRIARSIPVTQKKFRWRVGDYIRGEIDFRPGITEGCKIRLIQDGGRGWLFSDSKEFKIRNL